MAEKLTNGTIYLIEDKNNEVYKIGMTKGDARKRLKQLQTGNSTNLELLETYETEYPHRLETILHRRFKSKNTTGEWFSLTLEDVVNFKQTCESVDNIIQIMKDNIFFSKNLC